MAGKGILREFLVKATSGSLGQTLSQLAKSSEQQQQDASDITTKLRDIETLLQERKVSMLAKCERWRKKHDRPEGSLASRLHSWNPYKHRPTFDEVRLDAAAYQHPTMFEKVSRLILSLASHAEHLSTAGAQVIALRESHPPAKNNRGRWPAAYKGGT